MKKKRVLVLSDLHCGGQAGLTPPRWHLETKEDRWNEARKNIWKEYTKILLNTCSAQQELIVVVNGDCIDGSTPKGKEKFVYDRDEQTDMAVVALEQAKANKYYMTGGTLFHVGKEEDWEYIVAMKLGATFEERLFLDVNGVVFDFRHFVPNTVVPHNKAYQLGKERTWNLLWAEREMQPKVNITVRSHIHVFYHTGDDKWLGITTPALCGIGVRYGARRFSNVVHFGVVYFDVDENGEYEWGYVVSDATFMKAKLLKA